MEIMKNMDKNAKLGIVLWATLFFMIFILGFLVLDIQYQIKAVMVQDLNVLKSNDLAFANYIQTNSQTLTYINNYCKIIADNNETTTMICIKPKGAETQ